MLFCCKSFSVMDLSEKPLLLLDLNQYFDYNSTTSNIILFMYFKLLSCFVVYFLKPE